MSASSLTNSWLAATVTPGLAPPTEDDMTAPAIAGAARWWGGPGEPDFVAREIVGPLGIADLVGVRFDTRALKARSAAGISPIDDLLALRVVLACRQAARTTGSLSKILGVSESAVRRATRIAKIAGALDSASNRRHSAHPEWKPVTRRLVAVELKRSDWRRAADQTWAYSCWANATWMVLGQPPPRAALECLSASGVGLAYLGDRGQLTVVLRAKASRRAQTYAGIWAGEQALAHALASGADPLPVARAGSARSAGVRAAHAG